MRKQRYAIALGAAAGVWLLLNAAVAAAAAHPGLQSALFGTPGVHRKTPADVGLAYQTVRYASHRDAWWIPAATSDAPNPDAPTVVVIHGYVTARDPKSTEFAPTVELAQAFHSWGLNTLVINLGYATGAHPYSAGVLEARDVDEAVDWARARGGPVALWGFSAGGHTALLAAAEGARVAAVATDSAFVNASAVITDQAAQFTHLPRPLLAPSTTFFGWIAGDRPVDLTDVLERHPIRVPLLLIQGSGDKAISPDNLRRLQQLTHGQAWLVAGADHTKSYWKDPSAYLARARAFLLGSLR